MIIFQNAKKLLKNTFDIIVIIIIFSSLKTLIVEVGDYEESVQNIRGI